MAGQKEEKESESRFDGVLVGRLRILNCCTERETDIAERVACQEIHRPIDNIVAGDLKSNL